MRARQRSTLHCSLLPAYSYPSSRGLRSQTCCMQIEKPAFEHTNSFISRDMAFWADDHTEFALQPDDGVNAQWGFGTLDNDDQDW